MHFLREAFGACALFLSISLVQFKLDTALLDGLIGRWIVTRFISGAATVHHLEQRWAGLFLLLAFTGVGSKAIAFDSSLHWNASVTHRCLLTFLFIQVAEHDTNLRVALLD